MKGFEAATRVEGGDGSYRAEVDGDWCVWSPAGGYLMAIALRAAGFQTGFPAPLSMSCHFLSAPKLGEVALEVSSVRRTRVAESLRVSLHQQEKPVLALMIWSGETVEGYEHADAAVPNVVGAHEIEPHVVPDGVPGFQTLWKHLDHRPLGPMHRKHDDIREPRQRDWIRLRDFEPGKDAYLDGGRCALVLDAFTWPAAAHAHAGDARFIARTIAFPIEFHRRTRSEWLLSDSYVPQAAEGRIAIHNQLWDSAGELVASGSGAPPGGLHGQPEAPVTSELPSSTPSSTGPRSPIMHLPRRRKKDA